MFSRICFVSAMVTLMATAAYADTIKVGVIGPLTGGGAPWGIAAKVGYELAAKEVNDAGGLQVGDEKYDVQIISYDDKYKAAEAVSAYNRLVGQDGAKYILILASASTMALKGNVESDEVMAFTASYTRLSIDSETEHMFRLYSNPDTYAPRMIDWMADNLEEKKVVLLTPNDETGWDQSRLYKESFVAAGFEVIGEKLFERTTSDFAPIVTSVIEMAPDFVELGGTPPATAGLIVRQARELGYEGRFTKMGGPGPYDIIGGAGAEAAEGTINMLYADESNENYRALAAQYEAVTGHKPNEILVPFYDSAKVMLAAITAGGDPDDPEAAIAAMSEILPMTSLQGDELTLMGKDMYGVDREIATVNYIGEIRSGAPVVIGKAE